MNVVVVFGGKSVEHEISIISAFQVMEALKVKYNVIPVYISKDNKFYYDKKMNGIEYFKTTKKILNKKNKVQFKKKKQRYYVQGRKKMFFDIIFPVVHGKGSEDGSVLNYFRFQGFPIVGGNAAFYALAQDKSLTKKLLSGMNINNTKYRNIKRGEDYNSKQFNFPCIVKPNNLGSSLGIKVVNNFVELERAIAFCFRIDNEVIVEEYLENCKEYNISVLNNMGSIEVSEIEEVIKDEMFTFEDKYLKGDSKKGMANKLRKKSFNTVNVSLKKEISNIAKRIYKEMGASGVIRIDFLYLDTLYVNEINAIPGSYAFYLWEKKYDFLELLDIVIKEGKRDAFFANKTNELIKRNLIFDIA